MPDVRRQLLQRFADTTQECRLLGLPAGYVQYTRQLRRVLETALQTHGQILLFSLTQQPYTLWEFSWPQLIIIAGPGLVQSVWKLGCGLEDLVSIPGRRKEFSSSSKHPDRLWGIPSFLSKGNLSSFPGIKRPGREADHSSPSQYRAQEWSWNSSLLYALVKW